MTASRTTVNPLLAAGSLGILLLCAGCSSAPETQADDSERKVYRTGSNIPVRDRGQSSDVRVLDPATVERTAPTPVR